MKRIHYLWRNQVAMNHGNNHRNTKDAGHDGIRVHLY